MTARREGVVVTSVTIVGTAEELELMRSDARIDLNARPIHPGWFKPLPVIEENTDGDA
jgi:hypothetical protein